MASKSATVSSFVQSAPPGELANVINDIKVLAPNEVKLLEPAFKKYNEEQYTTVKLPGTSGSILISQYNSLGDGRYFDTASQTSFEVDHANQASTTASNPQPHPLDSTHSSTIQSLLKSFSAAATEHFPTSTLGVYPSPSSQIAILLVANKHSPQNFWNGRWRSTYLLDPSSDSLSGTVRVDVHYYEDGNVRMSSSKKVEINGTGVDGVVREIAKAENVFQEELNRAFDKLAEGSFKGLRRQLPVTRQRVEWEKIAGYRLGQDIGGGRSR
ncbi:F-actin-capping protein subunit alpha [Teratosphaeriaceae sp. CCFEE 6253]|nr:F-actin-capping protein subunit alpha [Teratosphaeriaceae sp. CCFEE 6253]